MQMILQYSKIYGLFLSSCYLPLPQLAAAILLNVRQVVSTNSQQ